MKLHPAWKHAVAELFSGKFAFGDVVSHEELQAVLGLPKPRGKIEVEQYESWRLSLLSQVDALTDYLLEEKNICLRSVIGEGYMLVKPEDQTAFAVKQGQKGLRRQIFFSSRR